MEDSSIKGEFKRILEHLGERKLASDLFRFDEKNAYDIDYIDYH